MLRVKSFPDYRDCIDIYSTKLDLHETVVGFLAAGAVSVCDRVLQTPEPKQNARRIAEKGGLVARI